MALSASGANTYTWSGGVLNGVSFNPISSNTYSLVATDGNGCQNSLSQFISVVAFPTVSAISSNSQVCSGFTTALIASGAATYTWSNGVGNGSAFVPLTSTVYSVIGSNVCGNASATVTVLVNMLPNVSIIASSYSSCSGGSLILQGSGANTYLWSGGITNNVAFSPSVSSNYTLTGTDVNLCQNTSTIAITVYSLPLISAHSSSTLVCLGSSVVLSGQGGVSYTWSGSVLNGVAFSPSSTSTYTVMGQDGYGCQNTAIISLSVISTPTIQANSTFSAVCFGNSTTLYGSGANTYTWSGGALDNTPFIPSATNVYTLTGTNVCGNTSTTIQVVVNPLPNLSITVSPSTSVCHSSSVSVLASGANTYTWSGGVQNGVGFIPLSGVTYTLNATDINGCQSNAIQNFTILSAPTVTATSSATNICFGDPFVLYGIGANTYTWSGGAIYGIPFIPTVTATYTLAGTNTLTGCSSTNLAFATVIVNPAATVIATANTPTICTSLSIILTASGVHTYTWSTGSNQTLVVLPIYSNTVFTVFGTNTITGCSSSASLSISTVPLPTISVSATNTLICPGTTVALTASGAQSYTCVSGQTIGMPFTPTASATYYVIGINTIAPSCIGVGTIYIGHIQAPNITVIPSSSNICIGGSVSLQANGANTYTWSSGVIAGVPFNPLTTSVYTVSGTSFSTGCSGSNTVLITVAPLPTVSTQISNSVVCTGGTVVLTGNGASTYSWSGGAINGLPHVINANSSFTVVGTNTLTGCTSTNLAVQHVSVNPLPVLLLNQLNPSICFGSPVTFSASGADVISWSGGISNGVPFLPAVGGNFTCTGTFTQTGCSGFISSSLTVNPLPILSITASSFTSCAGHPITLTASGANTYTWSPAIFNGQVFFPSVSSNYSVSGTNTLSGCVGKGTVALVILPSPILNIVATATNVCIGDSIALSANGAPNFTWNPVITNGVYFLPNSSLTYSVSANNSTNNCIAQSTVQIQVNLLPTVGITVSDSVLCVGEELVLSGSGASTYTWSTGFVGAIHGIIPMAGQIFSVVASDLHGCRGYAVFSPQVIECVGYSEYGVTPELKIYPNPSSRFVTVLSKEHFDLYILNQIGQILRIVKVNGVTDVDLIGLPKGIYFFKSNSKTGSIFKKVVLE